MIQKIPLLETLPIVQSLNNRSAFVSLGGIFMEEIEIWKEIPNYEGIYEASNLGKIRRRYKHKLKILKPFYDHKGYLQIDLTKNNLSKTFKVHQIIAITFLNHIPNGHSIVVNHKDFDKFNNRVDNLELITTRENTNKKHKKHSSIYTGVCWDKKNKKWVSCITIKGVAYFLGRFVNELDASIAYEKVALNNELVLPKDK